uniref:Uncharacterized protein n=1 Tax=Oryza sativa subsp. indica TaxID=39946 RepID=C5NNV0_ORYSI|nr:hypothetical protein [Oryza sativa Indica Group]
MARWSRSVKWEGLRWDGELGFRFYRRGVRRCRFGGGRTDLGGQSLGWRQRRFRGRCEIGDGVDALGGEGGGSDGRIRTTGAQAGAVKVGAASWRAASAVLCLSAQRDKGGERERGRARGKKEKGRVERRGSTMLLWGGRGGGRALAPCFGRERTGGGRMMRQQGTGGDRAAWRARTERLGGSARRRR